MRTPYILRAYIPYGSGSETARWYDYREGINMYEFGDY
jgi:hypothetical protein